MNQESRSGTKRSGAHLSGLQSHLDPKRAHKSTSHCPQRRPTAHYETLALMQRLMQAKMLKRSNSDVQRMAELTTVEREPKEAKEDTTIKETKEKKDSTSTIDDLEMLEEFPSDIEDVFQ